MTAQAARRLQQVERVVRVLICLFTIAACSPAPSPSREPISPPGPARSPAPSASGVVDARVGPQGPEPTPASTTPEPPATVELEVPGFLPATVIVPASVSRPAPLVVTLHGAGGRPEPHCDRYKEITQGRAFVLCTRGTPNNKHLPEEQRGYFYDGHHRLGQEVLAAMDALVARFQGEVDASRAVFAGYSQGASMGLLFLHEKAEHTARFGRALFVEGGFADWNIALSGRMTRSGLDRVALVCGQIKCKTAAERSLGYMKRGGLEGRLSFDGRGGHTYGGAVAPLVASAFEWLVQDDPRFGAASASR